MAAQFLGWMNLPQIEKSGLDVFNSDIRYFEKDAQLVVVKGEILSKDKNGYTPLALEDILNAYLSLGPQCLAKLCGHFSLVILLKNKEEVFLARDRIGVETIYYSLQNGGLLFSDHCHHLASTIPQPAQISESSLYHYFYFHFIPSPTTLYQHIYTLEPGHYALFKQGQIKTLPFWSAHFRATNHDKFKEKSKTLHYLLNSAVSLKTKENSGCFLSGGIDSSTILGLLSQEKTGTKAFSIGFDAEKFNEMKFAEIAAAHFKATHFKYFVTPQDIVNSLVQLVSELDQPFGNASLLPAYFCAKHAKEFDVKTLLAGDGGDELFGGNSRYVEQMRFAKYHLIPKIIRLSLIEPCVGWMPTPTQPNLISKAKNYIRHANAPMPERLEKYNLLNQIGPQNIFTPEFLQQVDTKASLQRLKAAYGEADADTMLSKMLCLDLKFTLADNDLRKVKYACDSAGMKVEFPFLDDAVLQFALNLPDHDKVSKGQLRHFYKQAMSDFLPKTILTKSKHGFGLPFGLWVLQNQTLHDFVVDHLIAFKQRHFVQPGFVDQLMTVLLPKYPNYYGVLVWNFLVLELWLQSHAAPTRKYLVSKSLKNQSIFQKTLA